MIGVERARELRRNATDAERKLWGALKQLRSEGYHFRRQAPIGPYYADFACHHARLIIELDGDQHGLDRQRTYDERRDGFLRRAGYTVVRVPNEDVFKNVDGVSDAIFEVLSRGPKSLVKLDPPPLAPPLEGEGNGAVRAADEVPE